MRCLASISLSAVDQTAPFYKRPWGGKRLTLGSINVLERPRFTPMGEQSTVQMNQGGLEATHARSI